MSLPSSYSNEIASLERELIKQQPQDVLQFCAEFFQRRLASQRAEFLLSQQHSGKTGTGMAEHSFPGSNPFGQQGASNGNMSRLEEEDEDHDMFASPTSTNFPPTARDNSSNLAPDATAAAPPPSSSPFGNFGNFGFTPSSGTRSNPPASATAGAMDPPQSFPSNYNLNRRTSVSAESLAPSANDESNWKPPNFPKSQDQENRLRQAVSRNFLFAHLDDEQSAQVLGALQERKIPAKDVSVITQGDVGDYFYVVESGTFDIYVSSTGKREAGPDGLGKKVGSSPAGSSFGELALMYNAPRAASVVSTGPSILWQLDRITFRRILMDSAFQRRRMYEAFLDSVPLLSSLTSYERSKIADALETQKYPSNTHIIKEGDVGAHFYILESGTAAVYKRGQEGKLKEYNKGDYFGELALLDDKPRAASVISETDVKVAMLGKDGFQRLLGPVEALMRRNDPSKMSDSTH
ncbi:camp-dependent protein kinase regulatory subunit [Myriangium duriaei CBS 260.36]|uniref:cAMP-dependent protein kinase regulatory subunit n=1 Tax=Myriangium duriaei CBS 260.36 TaxID=1168546 RepID=A0A9P4MFT7_9PEZI|nr:camp-dependent protein kinase regulatory subunit [Myriangium duriaei CBS 260.36]